MSIYLQIERLINFGLQKGLIEKSDIIYTRNSLFQVLEVDAMYNDFEINEEFETATEILEEIEKYAISKKMINDNGTEKDLFVTKVMGVLTPRPSNVINKFNELYKENKKASTDYFYDLSKSSNYIMVDRVKQNIEWDKKTDFGTYRITINVSKPEKTPEEIKNAKLIKSTGYPKCLLCSENVGFSGHLNHPARQNLRTIPLVLNNENWQMQYSPYGYYNEHSIVFKDEHTPMKISKETFVRLLDFVEFLPHYFIGSNADLPIVGGSILSHDHFQAGNYELPMAKAEVRYNFTSEKYAGITLSIVNWGMSVVRLTSKNKNDLVELANVIFNTWKNYSDEEVDILSHTDDTPHNTITPIARVNKNNELELDLVLRNNRTNEEHPDGIFHTHKETHHIKQENIGLIEVMGLAVLPKRLIEEFEEVKKYLNGQIKDEFDKNNIHYDWVKYLIEKYGTNNDEIKLKEIFEEEIGSKFSNCLVDCGVFKTDEIGERHFKKFVSELGFKEI